MCSTYFFRAPFDVIKGSGRLLRLPSTTSLQTVSKVINLINYPILIYLIADPGVNNAILRYDGAPVAEPTTTATPSTNPLVEANLVPLINPGAPGGSNPPDDPFDFQITLNVSYYALVVTGILTYGIGQ